MKVLRLKLNYETFCAAVIDCSLYFNFFPVHLLFNKQCPFFSFPGYICVIKNIPPLGANTLKWVKAKCVRHNGSLVVPFLERQFKHLINKKVNDIHNSRLRTIASSTFEKIQIFR